MTKKNLGYAQQDAPTSVPDMVDQPVQSSSWKAFWPLLNSLHLFMTCCSLIIPSPTTSVNWQWILMGTVHLGHKKKKELLRTKLTMSLPLHNNLSPEQHLICLLTPTPSLACHPFYKFYPLPKSKIYSINTNLTYWAYLVTVWQENMINTKPFNCN